MERPIGDIFYDNHSKLIVKEAIGVDVHNQCLFCYYLHERFSCVADLSNAAPGECWGRDDDKIVYFKKIY